MAASRRGIEEVVIDPVPFGRYLLLDPIAEGRIGTVHRACLRRDKRPDKLLAIKRVSLELSCDPGFAEHFNKVMSRAAEFEHLAHCAIEDVGRAPEGSLYAAMELVSGKDLGRVAVTLHERGEVMPAPLVAYVGSCVADALAAAHAIRRAGKPAPLYHGELAPADILIGYDGAVRLTGLGSVALQAALPDPALRYAYRAPELERYTCSAQGDVFSLGACLYELLTGGPALIMEAHGSGAGGPVSHRRESYITQVIPRPLEEIVSRALAELPAARWQNAAEMARALQAWCSTQSTPADASTLSAFMRALFDATHKAETTRLQAALARLPGARPNSASVPISQPVPEPRPSYAQLVRASEHNRARAPARRDAQPESPQVPSEQTPPRGVLMQQLAADMAGGERSPQRAPDAKVPAVATRPSAKATPSTPAPSTGEQWDDESPADRWISESEEQESTAWRAQALKPAATQRKPASLAAPAAAAVAQMSALSGAARPSRAARLLVPAFAAVGVLVLIAGVAMFRRGGSEPSAIHEADPASTKVLVPAERLAIAPAHKDGLTADPATARAPGSDVEPEAQAAPAPQAVQHGSSRRRRAALGQEVIGAEPEASEAADEPADERPWPAAAPVARQEPAAAEPTPPVAAIRAHTEPIVATAPSAKPAAAASAAAPAATTALAARRPATTASSGVSSAPVLIEQTEPRLSARAKRSGITEGFVTIEFTVDRTGAVTNASVVNAEPRGVFDEEALKAIRQWRYRPKLTNGTPVESRQRSTIRFAE